MADWQWTPGRDSDIIVNSAVCLNCRDEVTATDLIYQRECCECGALAVYGGTVFLGREGGGEFHDTSLIGTRM